jgi:hypothetical protein
MSCIFHRAFVHGGHFWGRLEYGGDTMKLLEPVQGIYRPEHLQQIATFTSRARHAHGTITSRSRHAPVHGTTPCKEAVGSNR